MKNIRHINIRNTAIAIVALAGLAVATTACFGNSSTESATKALDATIEAVADQPEDAAKSTPTSTVSRVTTEVESATPATAAPATAEPASPEATPETEATETETETEPSTEAPATTTPATASPSIPALALSPTIVFVTFDQDGTNVNTSIVVEEAGLGRNDIVSVEFTYTKFGTERTVTATKASSTTTSSLWLVESLMLPVGSTVKIHAVDARGNSDDITKTVVLSTAMG
jgi:type IV secretory pathway VirB10-like protein